jgi:hypothetical protein
MRDNLAVDFAMRFDRWYRPLATAIGLGPKRTTIRMDGDTLCIRHGWAFGLDIPLADIASVRPVSRRPFSWGVHTGGDVWLVNASRDGIVELTLRRPATSKSVKRQSNSWGEVRSLYLSLEDPASFVTVLGSAIQSRQ